ncbi:uncharacterized protein FIBRA_06255 [Fibroporia radiculosa]|uniref:FAD/NAD(P)-binding domain-containing protein n=1 Tax=Fibroporia radiculosa TaxID=599839 RepID=J4IB60_9APHY|nr:uncharacterized protein FIBRA_06255 [Fibroporia radiculosa]CCM04096.1 predicted protein [Fibroporia radiculosa]
MNLELQDIAANWLRGFGLAAFSHDVSKLVDTFLPHGWLRDALVFTWDTRSLDGRDTITAYLRDTLAAVHLSNFKLDERPGLCAEYALNGSAVAAGFAFEMPDRLGHGYVYLQPDEATGDWKALSVFMNLEEIKGHEEAGPEPGVYGGHTLAWEEVNGARRARIESDPHVLIMGGGQTGLQIAARFKQMNIPTIVIEKHKTIGDQWRQRYPTLSLHTTRNHHTFLYQPYPRNWPLFTPRDKVADWLKQYAESQDLVVWTNSQILPTPTYDPQRKRWDVVVNRDGVNVRLRPAHIVIAIGTLGAPRVPQIPGQGSFKGTVMHASSYMGGEPFAGKRAVVIGAGNTSADICQDLAFRGAETVTMLQRSSTCVVSIKSVTQAMFRNYPDGMPSEVCDLRFNAMPLNLQRRMARAQEAQRWEQERELHAKFKGSGLKLNMGKDGTGQHFLVYERIGGYWIDVGLADMVESGRVKIKQGVELSRFEEDRLMFTDGTELLADLVVFATGYTDPRESLRDLFGAELIDRTKPLWDLDEEGEVQGCYRPTGHPGLWYGAGDFTMSRFLSKQLALQIKAIQIGMIPQVA